MMPEFEGKDTDKEDLAETRASLAEAQNFLHDLQPKCQDTSSQFEERTKTMQMEPGAATSTISSRRTTSQYSRDLIR